MVKLIRASYEDAEIMSQCMRAAYSKEIFDFDDKNEVNKHPTPDNIRYHIEHNIYYKIELDGAIIGGVFIVEEDEHTVSIQDFCISPNHQNKGYGQSVIKELENIHGDRKKWELTTPVYSVRNQRLYEKHGYMQVKIADYGGTLCVYYEKYLP